MPEESSMRRHRLLALVLLVLPASASAATPDTLAPDTGSSRSTPADPDTAKLQAMLVRADEAAFAGRLGEARRLYREVARRQQESDQFADVALWRLATSYLWDDATQQAAMTLDELAQAAARFGDPATELRATFEAAVLWGKVRRQDLVAIRTERVRSLFQSPVIASDVKEAYRRRIVEP